LQGKQAVQGRRVSNRPGDRGHQAVWLAGHLQPADPGRPALVEGALASSIAGWRMAGERFLAVRVRQLLGHVQRTQGRLDAVLGTYQQALEVAAAPGRPGLPGAASRTWAWPRVAYQRGELDTALRHATEGAVPAAHSY
jgi:MalT-like TPR region